MGVWSRPTANPCRSMIVGGGLSLLRSTALVVFARELIDRWIFHDVLAGQFPGLLDDPRERAVLPRGLVLDLFQHLLGEVQGLLALVGTGHDASSLNGRKVREHRSSRTFTVSIALLLVRLRGHAQIGAQRLPA